MREKRSAQANEVDMQAHSRRDKGHATNSTAMEPVPTVTETTQENCPVFVHQLGSQEKVGFAVSDLVWGKVKSHPWWPGQIVDPSDASTLAIKCQKKDTLLVAYFWDKTFAWCDEYQLKPFFSNFSAFEKQVGSDTFSAAVKSALKEVSRRIDAGTICSCLNEKSLFKAYPKIENAGVRQGFEYYTVDRSEVVNFFNPRGLVGFIRDLALHPDKGTTDKLWLLVSKYHIKAFRRWAAFASEKQTEPVIVPTVKPKRRSSRLSDLSNKTNTGAENVSAKKCKVDSSQTQSEKGFSGSDNMQDSLYWWEMSLRVQADRKQVVSAGKQPIIMPVVEKKSDKGIPTALLLNFSNRYGKVPSDIEVLRMFSRYGPLKGEMEKEVEGSESQVKLVFKMHADAEMAFSSLRKQNVFGSSLLRYRLVNLHTEIPDSSHQEKVVEVPNGGDHGPLEERRVEVPNGEDHGLLEDRRIEVPNEFNPTTVLLNFSNKSGDKPSEIKLTRMFSRHGPLKEGGVEKVEGTENQFRITFKKHSSAEMAFTSLRKQNVFGPSLLSYRLVSLPVGASKKSLQENYKAANKEDWSNLKVPAPRENLVQSRRAIGDNRAQRPVNTDVGLMSTVQGDFVAQGEIAGEMSVSPSSIVAAVNVDDVSIAPLITISGIDVVCPESKKQGEDAVVMSFDQPSSVQNAAVAEMQNDPSSTIRVGKILVDSSSQVSEMLVDPSSIVQGETFGEMPIYSASTGKGKTVEVSIVSSRAPEGEISGGCEMLINPSSTAEGKTIGEVPTVTSRTKGGEVGAGGKMQTDPLSTGQEDTFFEMPIERSGMGEDREPSTKKLDDSPANSMFSEPNPNSNGSMHLECTPSRSAIRSGTTPPFQKSSPIWRPVESLELFARSPQQPHFKKLERYCPEMRDGMAIGLMVTYANLVDSIKEFSFDDDMAIIEQKSTCLETLEENGFNVDPIRNRLNRLRQIKTGHAGAGLKQAELEKQLAKSESDSMSMVRLIEKLRSDVAKLDEQINALSEQSRTLVDKRDRLLEQTVGNGHEISRLKNELSYVNSSQSSACEEFARVLAEPFGGGSGM